MGGQLQRIRHPSQLAALSAWHLFPRRPQDRLEIDAQGPSAARIRAWERELNGLRDACGCEQGAAGLLAGAGGYTLFLLLRSGGWSDVGRRELWIGLVVVVVTTSLGKLLGLFAAQRRLKRLVAEIQGQWQPPADLGTGPALGQATWSRALARQTGCCGRRTIQDG
jgi:hypothetical protein